MAMTTESSILHIALHKIGNKTNDEGYILSQQNLQLSEAVRDLLRHYFCSPFKPNEYFHLHHESELSLNEVYSYVSAIFDNPQCLHEQSVHLAKHLYAQSTHAKIKAGEFYVVYFKDYFCEGETCDAVGLFKSENKDTFLKVLLEEGAFNVESEEGVNINKLDKGCLIFNKEREQGYIVAVIDNTNKSMEAQYWIDDFLHLHQRKDEYFNTEHVLSMCKNFVTQQLPQQFEVSRADQVDLLNKSVKFFKENDKFDLKGFAQEVMEQPDVIESFNRYKGDFEAERRIEISDQFAISDFAVKKQARSFKSIIKLDKNFHIYVHGNRKLIEQGEDEKGKFYKMYYQEEN
ncbi:MAG: nucleoid-associated protein [Bacteroidales bacterium]